MLSLAQFDLPVLVAALLIGVLTGRWMFRSRPAAEGKEDRTES
jgi:hypothetical protein